MVERHTALYDAAGVRALDQLAIESHGVPGYELMCRAGAFCFARLLARWPDCQRAVLVCGTGNNGGDGFVIARLMVEAGLEPRVFIVGDVHNIADDARTALDAMRDDLNTPEAIAAALDGVKLLNGIGDNLNGASARSAQAWLEQINDLLGIVYPEATTGLPEAETDDPLAEQVEALLAERKQARADKDFARADAIRDELDALGIEVMDSPDGSTWRRKSDFGI